MSQATAAWSAVSLCWSLDVYIPELSFRFWRLTLQVIFPLIGYPATYSSSQIISRFKTWLDQSLAIEIPQQSTTADKVLVPFFECAGFRSKLRIHRLHDQVLHRRTRRLKAQRVMKRFLVNTPRLSLTSSSLEAMSSLCGVRASV